MMKTTRRILLVLLAGLTTAAATPEGAEQVVRDYEAKMADWSRKVNEAASVEARRQLWKQVPDSKEFGAKLVGELNGNWDKEWTLDYTPKLLELAPAYAKTPTPKYPDKTPAGVIRDMAAKYHFTSEKVGDLAIALVNVDNGRTAREFIEKLESTHASKKVQGQAALALAILYAESGESPEVKARRLQLLRKAIINANNAPALGATVGEVADALIFQIKNLEKGMTAPDLLGYSVSGEAERLSDYRGKPVALVFWHSRMEASEETMDFLRDLENRLKPQGAVVLGVASEDRGTLRAMVKEGIVTWPNLIDSDGAMAKKYQVTRYPMAWVLDAEGRIQYRGVPGAFLTLTVEGLLEKR